MGPLDGVKIIELAGLGALPFGTLKLADMGADVIRVHPPGEVPEDKPDAPRQRVRPRSSVDHHRPQVPRGGRGPAAADRGRRRHARGLPPWGHRAPRRGARRRSGPQPQARLRPPHRVGPGRTAGPVRRPLPQLRGHHRRHRLDRLRRPAARSAAAGPRRLRRWWSAPGLRRGVRPVRGAAVRQGTGGRQRHGRRGDVDLLGLLHDDPERRAHRPGGHEPVRRRGALLQRVRDRPTGSSSASPRSSPGSTPSCSRRSGSTRPTSRPSTTRAGGPSCGSGWPRSSVPAPETSGPSCSRAPTSATRRSCRSPRLRSIHTTRPGARSSTSRARSDS